MDEVELVGVCQYLLLLHRGTTTEMFQRVYAEGIASFDQEAHRFALEQMRSVLGVEVAVTHTSARLSARDDGRC